MTEGLTTPEFVTSEADKNGLCHGCYGICSQVINRFTQTFLLTSDILINFKNNNFKSSLNPRGGISSPNHKNEN